MTTTRWCSRKSRAAFARLLKQGWVDAIRKVHPEETVYTFWDYRRTDGSAMPGCASTICCSARSWRAG